MERPKIGEIVLEMYFLKDVQTISFIQWPHSTEQRKARCVRCWSVLASRPRPKALSLFNLGGFHQIKEEAIIKCSKEEDR